MKPVFYSETELNGKFQVMTSEKLEGKGIKNYGGSNPVEYKGEVFFGNTNYWVTKEALENLKNNLNLLKTCF